MNKSNPQFKVKMTSPTTNVPGAAINNNIDLTVEIPPQQQFDGDFLNRRIRNVRRSQICKCTSIAAIAAIYAFVFFVIPATVLFTGIGLIPSTDQEKHNLGVRMAIGGGSALGFSIVFSYCGLSAVPLLL